MSNPYAKYNDIEDETLIVRLREGEFEIADYLMDKYKGLVRQKAHMLFLVGGDTDDLIQEGMIGLFKAVRDYSSQHQASFRTFASVCIERQMYKAVEAYSRKKHLPLNNYISLDTGDPLHMMLSEDPETLVIDREKAEILQKKIQGSLSKMENAVLERYLEGNSYAQIAEALGKSPKSVDNAIRRIRSKVRETMERN